MSRNLFWVLRRWNSYTPRIPSLLGTSRGGGYLLVWDGKGIAIDPGFNFLDNLYHYRSRAKERYDTGLGIKDINAVLVSHNHIDHTADLESIVMMKAERIKRARIKEEMREQGIDFYLNEDTYKKYYNWLHGWEPKVVNSVEFIKRQESKDLSKEYSLRVRALSAYHGDKTQKNALGFIIQLLNDGKIHMQIGMTGDTKYPGQDYEEDWIEALKNCDIVVAHLGGLNLRAILCNSSLHNRDSIMEGLDEFKDPEEKEIFKRVFDCEEEENLGEIFSNPYKPKSGHLGFWGVFTLFKRVFSEGDRTRIGIISEFGEELGSYRHKIAKVLNKTILGNNFAEKRIYTGDLGLVVELPKRQETCKRCGKIVPIRIACSRCGMMNCQQCIDEYSIKHREKGMFYNHEECYKPEYGPRAGTYARESIY